MSAGAAPAGIGGEGFAIVEALEEFAAQARDVARNGLHRAAERLGLGRSAESAPDMDVMYAETPPKPAEPTTTGKPQGQTDFPTKPRIGGGSTNPSGGGSGTPSGGKPK